MPQYTINIKGVSILTESPLHLIAMSGTLEQLNEFLQKHRMDIDTLDDQRNTPLHFAAVNPSSSGIVRELLARGANPNAQNRALNAPLHKAVLINCIKSTDALLSQPGILVNIKGYKNITPLHYAVEQKHTESIELLLKHGADLHLKDDTGRVPWEMAEKSGSKAIKKIFKDEEIRRRSLLLNEKLAELNSNGRAGNTMLHAAAALNNFSILSLELEKKVQPNIKNSDGDAALHIAVEENSFKCVEVLIEEENIDLNVKNKEGETPLHLAVKNRNIEMVKLLVKKASPNVRDKNGNTCLHCAVQAGDTQMVSLLIQYDANPHQQNDKCDTALHEAVRQGSVEMATILLQCGVNPTVRNDAGENALGLVKEDQEDLKTLLNKYWVVHTQAQSFSDNSSIVFSAPASQDKLEFASRSDSASSSLVILV